jgi:FHS family L-fucose permease-like MFS transporter
MGAVSDASSINIAILVPTVCFVVVGSFAWNAARVPAHDLKAVPAL